MSVTWEYVNGPIAGSLSLLPYLKQVNIGYDFQVLPNYLSIWTTEKVKAEGVNIINNVQVKSAKLNQESGEVNLLLDDGQTVTTDHVVVAVGIEPETDLAKESGLAVDDNLGGFKVNEELEARYIILHFYSV